VTAALAFEVLLPLLGSNQEPSDPESAKYLERDTGKSEGKRLKYAIARQQKSAVS
jgi:hypothetical protein